MHKLIGAACRRTAGVTAGVILTGGVVGGVLLTPGTAFAAAPDTTTAVTASQTPSFHGTTLNVGVSVTATSGTAAPTGSVVVTGAAGGCTANLVAGASTTSTGSCSIADLPDGTYTLKGTYADSSATFNGSSGTDTVTIAPATFAPVFDVASPPLSATSGQDYSYTFHAKGSPAPTYTMSGGSGWLHVDSNSGTVWGTVPSGADSFGFSVTATNSAGSVTTDWFTVNVDHGYGHGHGHGHANLDTYLSCTSPVFTGHQGSCTLWVSNHGYSSASDVSAQIALPEQLRADYCGYFFYYGCRIFGNTAYENLGTLYPGQTKSLTVVFTARNGFFLFGWHHGFRFTVKVVGSASSFDNFGFFGHGASYSAAYVTIIPRGHWW
jgi:hypothetical protein